MADNDIIISLLLRDEMSAKMAAARTAIEGLSESEKKLALAEHAQAVASQEAANSAGKQASSVNVLKGSWTEMMSTLGAVKQIYGQIDQVLKATVGETITYAAQIRELSRTIGSTAEQSSILIQAADDVGISAGTIQTAMEAAIRKGVRPTIDGLAELSAEYNAIQDPIAKTEFLMKNFGRAGADLAPLMKLGAEGIKEAGQAAQDSGLVMSGQAVQAARDYEIAMDNLSDAAMGVKLTIGNALIPVLSSAADAANLLITQNQQLTNILGQHSTEVIVASDSYAEYRAEMERSVKVTGMTIDAEGNLRQALAGVNESVRPLVQSNFVLTESQFNMRREWEAIAPVLEGTGDKFAGVARSIGEATSAADANKAAMEANKVAMAFLSLTIAGPLRKEYDSFSGKQGELQKKLAETRAEMDKLQRTQGAVVKTTEKNSMSSNELALASLKLAQAQGELGKATDPMKQAQLRVEIEGLSEKIGGANTSVTSYVNNSKKLGELKGTYDELNAQIAGNAQAHDDATKRIMFDLLSQRAAIGDVSDDERKALNEIALKWGLVDQETHDAVIGMDDALAALASSRNIDLFVARIGGIGSAAAAAAAALAGLAVPGVDMPGGPAAHQAAAASSAPTGAANRPRGAQGFAAGGSFTVPPGYLGDTYPMRVSSGEHVTVTPAGRPPTNNQSITINANDPRTVAYVLNQARRGRLAQMAAPMGS